jgi:hypothetical protein
LSFERVLFPPHQEEERAVPMVLSPCQQRRPAASCQPHRPRNRGAGAYRIKGDARAHLNHRVAPRVVELRESSFFPSPRGRARRADGAYPLPTAPAGRELSAPPAQRETKIKRKRALSYAPAKLKSREKERKRDERTRDKEKERQRERETKRKRESFSLHQENFSS